LRAIAEPQLAPANDNLVPLAIIIDVPTVFNVVTSNFCHNLVDRWDDLDRAFCAEAISSRRFVVIRGQGPPVALYDSRRVSSQALCDPIWTISHLQE
jgi:hypothetical protein